MLALSYLKSILGLLPYVKRGVIKLKLSSEYPPINGCSSAMILYEYLVDLPRNNVQIFVESRMIKSMVLSH